MLRAFSSVANDGVMVEPKFINAIHDPKTNTARKTATEIIGNHMLQKSSSNHSGLYGSSPEQTPTKEP